MQLLVFRIDLNPGTTTHRLCIGPFLHHVVFAFTFNPLRSHPYPLPHKTTFIYLAFRSPAFFTLQIASLQHNYSLSYRNISPGT